jgi:hypothetical protein
MGEGVRPSKGTWANPDTAEGEPCIECCELTLNRSGICTQCTKESVGEKTPTPFDVEFYATRKPENDQCVHNDAYAPKTKRKREIANTKLIQRRARQRALMSLAS